MTREHSCDDSCRCPIHQLSLIYAPSTCDHACQRTDCVFTHGMKGRRWLPIFSRRGMRERFNGILRQKLWSNRFFFSDSSVLEQTAYLEAFRECGLTVAASFNSSGALLFDRDDLVGTWGFSSALNDKKITESADDSSCRMPPLDVTTAGYFTPETVRKAMTAYEIWPISKGAPDGIHREDGN